MGGPLQDKEIGQRQRALQEKQGGVCSGQQVCQFLVFIQGPGRWAPHRLSRGPQRSPRCEVARARGR